MTTPDAGHPATELTPLGWIGDALRRSTSRAPSAEAEEALAELFPTGPALVEYVLRFCSLMVLSASIAAFGLLADSAGVVIGAMLVAPLMTPILAASAATVRAYNRQLLISVGIIALGTAMAIGVGFVVSAVAGGGITGPTELPAEIASRTYPSLLDLGIAVSAGAAAGYILPRRSATSALPGVGIAVALVPPLATVGITLELDLGTDARNALLLFLTNLAAIVFSASVMLLLAGFRPELHVSRRRLLTRIAITLGAVVAVAVPLTLHTRSRLAIDQLKRDVTQSVEEWDGSAQITSLDVRIDGGAATVQLIVTGPNDPDEMWALGRAVEQRHQGPVDLEVRYAQDRRFEVAVR